MERRYLQNEVRAITDGGVSYIEGTAIVFNSQSENLGSFREIISPSAADDVLNDANLDCRALINHDNNLVLGRTKSGTLQLWKDDEGVKYRIQLDTSISYANDLVKSINRGDISGSSFGFSFIWDTDDSWSRDKDGTPVRTINRIRELYDVSPVTFPAYPETDVAVVRRSIDKLNVDNNSKSKSIERRIRLLELSK